MVALWVYWLVGFMQSPLRGRQDLVLCLFHLQLKQGCDLGAAGLLPQTLGPVHLSSGGASLQSQSQDWFPRCRILENLAGMPTTAVSPPGPCALLRVSPRKRLWAGRRHHGQ